MSQKNPSTPPKTDAAPEATTVPIEHPKKQKKSFFKRLKWFVLVLIIVAAAVGTYGYYVTSHKQVANTAALTAPGTATTQGSVPTEQGNAANASTAPNNSTAANDSTAAQPSSTAEAATPAPSVSDSALRQTVEAQKEALASAQDALQTQQNSINQLSDQVATLTAQLSTAQQQIRTLSKQLLVALRQRQTQPEQVMQMQLLTEAGSLLRIAQRQLLIAHDANSAINALALAKSMLEGQANGRFQPLVEAIDTQLVQLQGLASFSQSVLFQQVQALSQQFSQMNPGYFDQFSGQNALADQTKDAESTSKDNRVMQWLKTNLGGLVSVEKLSQSNLAYMNQMQRDTIRDTVAVNLLTAEKALQLGDTALWKSSLARVSLLLTHFYDPHAPQYAGVQALLKQLENKPITVSLPSLDNVLSLYQQLRSTLMSSGE